MTDAGEEDYICDSCKCWLAHDNHVGWMDLDLDVYTTSEDAMLFLMVIMFDKWNSSIDAPVT